MSTHGVSASFYSAQELLQLQLVFELPPCIFVCHAHSPFGPWTLTSHVFPGLCVGTWKRQVQVALPHFAWIGAACACVEHYYVRHAQDAYM